MSFWGWRPLISTLFISVLVTGCGINSDTALTLTPTSLPRVTLTLRDRAPNTPTPPPSATSAATPTPDEPSGVDTYAVRPGDTLLGIALDYGLEVDQLKAANPGINPRGLQVGQQINIPPPGFGIALAPTPVALDLPPPTCFDLVTGSMICIGEVHNQQAVSAGYVRVRVGLLLADGTLLDETVVGVAQSVIPPGAAAPYSVIFNRVDYDIVTASLFASWQDSHFMKNWTVLPVEIHTVEVSSSRYRVTASISNNTGRHLGSVRAVLTILDEEGQVAGFRSVMTGDGLAPGETRTITLDAFSQLASSATLSHRLHVEARYAD